MLQSGIGLLSFAPQVLLAIIAAFWFDRICKAAPEPYLDEVFHIGQAQAYISNRWDIWDPKITTPPGLYLVSYVQSIVLKSLGIEDISSPSVLRCVNVVFGGVLLLVLVRQSLSLISKDPESIGGKQSSNALPSAALDKLTHTAFNICLFPPLFFFYGLYYTDVLSACSVLYAYNCYLRKEYVKVIFADLASLLFRQTNVFWVAVFLGGLELARTLPKGRPDVEFPRRANYHDVILGSWKHRCVFDPLVGEAPFEEHIKTAISLAIVTVISLFTKPTAMFWSLSSYVLVLLAFIEFVIWNGGVVLGDKENHVASIHLAQMLYLWPYFLFFSFPLLLPYLLNAFLPQEYLPQLLRTGSLRSQLPRIATSIPIIATMMVVVHYNTIVHPFTLADNRHYMFYIFRVLLRHPLIKYLAVPIYFASAWTCLTALSNPGMQPSPPPPPQKLIRGSQGVQNRLNKTRVSFSLIWLLTTALSLCSAPLVEPRYLIVPWLIWRMHVVPSEPSAEPTTARGTTPENAKRRAEEADTPSPLSKQSSVTMNLWLETAWFLLINFVTGYIFLYWGFEWPQEPGKVQRFMW